MSGVGGIRGPDKKSEPNYIKIDKSVQQFDPKHVDFKTDIATVTEAIENLKKLIQEKGRTAEANALSEQISKFTYEITLHPEKGMNPGVFKECDRIRRMLESAKTTNDIRFLDYALDSAEKALKLFKP